VIFVRACSCAGFAFWSHLFSGGAVVPPPMRNKKPVSAKVRVPIEFISSRDRVREAFEADVLPVPTFQARPNYPTEMRRAGYGGEVRLRFIVNASGRPEHIRVKSSPHPDFEDAATRALEQWVFKPGQLEGKPVATWLEIPIVFSINQ
jgi:TonB family protein